MNKGIWYFEDKDFSNFFCMRKVKEMQHQLAQGERTYDKDDHIYLQGEPADHVYMIKSGRVKVGSYTDEGKEIVKTIMNAGEIFGELAIAGEDKRQDFAQALEANTIICPLTVNDMRQMMDDDRELSFVLFKLIGLRMRKLERRLELLIAKDARTRVVEFLKDMAKEKGQKVGYELMIKSHLKHQDIASLTGTSRQTVTTILNDLKDKSVIKFDRRRILIRDLTQLK